MAGNCLWRMLSKISQRINLTLGFISALLCLSPIIYLDEAKNFPTDDTIAFKQTIGALVERSPSLLASFFVVLIPAADLLLDLPSKISSYWNCSAKESNDTSVVVRLNDPERFLFMLGICIQSSVWFLPPSTDLRSLSIVYFCTTNASFLLVGGSILTFLQRCTETFSTLRATLITVAAVVGFPTMSLCNFVRYDNRTYHTLNAVGWFIAAIGGIVYASLILLCAFKYCRVKLLTASDRQALLTCLLRTFRRTGLETKGIKDNSADNDSELYTNYIPGVHMAAMLMVIVASMAVGSTTGQNGIDAYECRNYAIIVAEIVVLVVELRIRKNEIARGLVRMVLHPSIIPSIIHWQQLLSSLLASRLTRFLSFIRSPCS